MQNVTINSKKYGVRGDTPIKLNNGSLVLHYNKIGDVLGAYLVTSFRDGKGRYNGDQTFLKKEVVQNNVPPYLI